MAHNLPQSLVAALTDRIADPKRRQFRTEGQDLGSFDNPEELFRLMDQDSPDGSSPFRDVVAQMNQWGQSMPTMHVIKTDGGLSVSSTNQDDLTLAAPASAQSVAALEALVGRSLPGDLMQMWGIGDGGWGPGYSYTIDHGAGLHSVEGCGKELEDLRRRGPGYTGEMEWPANLLPLTEGGRGMVSYDLDRGHIVTFDDYWYDRDIAIEEAFSVTHLTLAEYLQEWLES